jgi:hypothetical protein
MRYPVYLIEVTRMRQMVHCYLTRNYTEANFGAIIKVMGVKQSGAIIEVITEKHILGIIYLDM